MQIKILIVYIYSHPRNDVNVFSMNKIAGVACLSKPINSIPEEISRITLQTYQHEKRLRAI